MTSDKDKDRWLPTFLKGDYKERQRIHAAKVNKRRKANKAAGITASKKSSSQNPRYSGEKEIRKLPSPAPTQRG